MKIVIAGGSGQIGNLLGRAFFQSGHEIVVLSREARDFSFGRGVVWDASTLNENWSREIAGADVVINLAGRSVNCRYNAANRKAIMDSRVLSTRAVGKAIEKLKNPPCVWLQMSTATIYAHRFDAPNDEYSGIIGGQEKGAPDKWRFSIEVAKAWEAALHESSTPNTRKVLLRSAMVMSVDKGGVFDVLLKLVRLGLGGRAGNGKQFMSWIHGRDFVRAMEFIFGQEELEGAVNICAPHPLSNAPFMLQLRRAWGTKIGLTATKEMIEIATRVMGTESELVLKSRRVVPTKLLRCGFEFEYSHWREAARDLCAEWRSARLSSTNSS